MSDDTGSGPVMAGSDDASDRDRRAGLAEQVEHDHGGEGAAAQADELEERDAETKAARADRGGTAG